MFMLDEAIVEWGAISARRTCIVDGSRRLTFGELEQVSRARAIELRSVGVGAGDRVVVLAPNSTESVVAIAAVLRSGYSCRYLLKQSYLVCDQSSRIASRLRSSRHARCSPNYEEPRKMAIQFGLRSTLHSTGCWVFRSFGRQTRRVRIVSHHVTRARSTVTLQ